MHQWWNYEKPRPQLRGAATLAVKNNVPILPVFVRAFGLVLGQLFHSLWMFIIFMGLLIMPSVILLLSKSEENVNSEDTKEINKRTFFILIILIMIVVLIRSFVGVASPISFDKTTFLILMIGLLKMITKKNIT